MASTIGGAPPGGSLRLARGVRLAVILALLLDGAAPFCSGGFLPSVEVAVDLGLASVLDRYGDAETGFARYYRISSAITPYWGYYGPMWLLGRLFPVEIANKIFLSVWAIALPLSVGAFLRALGRDPRWALLALPLVWNRQLFFGFTSFLASIPLFFAALALLVPELDATERRPRREALLALAFVAVFLAHVQTFLLLGLFWIVLVGVGWRGGRWAARRARAVAPAVALWAGWLVSLAFAAEPAMAPLHAVHRPRFGRLDVPQAVDFEGPWELLAQVPERLWGAYRDGSDDLLGGLWLALLAVALLLDRRAAAGGGEGGRRSLRERLRERRPEVLFALALAAYLLLPYELAGQPYFNVRYLLFAALLAPVLLRAPMRGRRGAALGIAAGALALATDVNAAWKIGLFQRQVGDFPALLELMEPGGRTLGLVFDAGERQLFRLDPFLHFPAYYQVERGGDLGFSFAGTPSNPVRYRPGMQAPHPDEWNPLEFDWDEMAAHYDWFLVRGRPAGDALLLEGRAERVAWSGAWRLYRNDRGSRRSGEESAGPAETGR